MSTATSTYTKVFVGNLSFKTKANELAAEFSAAGKVVSANIITRGPRSLGYGFVEMENEEDAHKSVTLLNKKNIDGRDINVEVARPRDEAKIAERREQRDKQRSERVERGERGERVERTDRSERGEYQPRRRFAGRPRTARRVNGDATAPAANDRQSNDRQSNERQVSDRQAPIANDRQVSSGDKPVRGNNRPQRRNNNQRRAAPGKESIPQSVTTTTSTGSDTEGASSPSVQKTRRTRKPRASRKPRVQTPKVASTTTLFVANLPFVLTDEGLTALFKDTKPVKAHVVMNRNGRSKGFGFVEYATEEEQKAGLAASEKVESEGRVLAVKVAWIPPVIEAAPAAETPAAETPAAEETPKTA